MRRLLLSIATLFISAPAFADTMTSSTSTVSPSPAPAEVEETYEGEPGGASGEIVAPPPTNGKLPLSVDVGFGWYLYPSAQYRVRFLGDTGRNVTDKDTRAFVNHRARVGLSLAHGDGYELMLQIQDTRMWGEEASTLTIDANGVDFHQVYALIPIIGRDLRLKIGRQELVMEDERFMANAKFRQRGRTFNAIKLEGVITILSFNAFVAKVVEADQDEDGTVPDGRTFDVDLGMANVEYRWPTGKVGLSYFFDGDYAQRSVRHTATAWSKGSLLDFDYNARVAYQFGSEMDETVNAGLVAARVGKTLDVQVKPTFMLIGEYLSSDGTRQGTFDTLYGANHRYYGEMDYFRNIPRDTGNSGLVDLAGRLELKPVDSVTLRLDFHHFRRASRPQDTPATFGNELNAVAVVKLGQYLALRTLYGLFSPPGDADMEHLVFSTLDLQI